MDATMEAPVPRMAPFRTYRTAAARLFSPIQRVLNANTAVPTQMSGSVHHTASGEQPFPFSVLGCAGQMLAQLNKLFHLEHEYPVLYHAILEEPAAGLAGFLDSAYPTGLASATTLELAEVLAPDSASGHRPAYSMDCMLGASNFPLWCRLIADEEDISSDLKRQRATDNFLASRDFRAGNESGWKKPNWLAEQEEKWAKKKELEKKAKKKEKLKKKDKEKKAKEKEKKAKKKEELEKKDKKIKEAREARLAKRSKKQQQQEEQQQQKEKKKREEKKKEELQQAEAVAPPHKKRRG
jgi:primosomal protein N'